MHYSYNTSNTDYILLIQYHCMHHYGLLVMSNSLKTTSNSKWQGQRAKAVFLMIHSCSHSSLHSSARSSVHPSIHSPTYPSIHLFILIIHSLVRLLVHSICTCCCCIELQCTGGVYEQVGLYHVAENRINWTGYANIFWKGMWFLRNHHAYRFYPSATRHLPQAPRALVHQEGYAKLL